VYTRPYMLWLENPAVTPAEQAPEASNRGAVPTFEKTEANLGAAGAQLTLAPRVAPSY